MSAEFKRVLAIWRRRGHGLWLVRLIIIGWDEIFSYYVPGWLSEKKAKKRGKKLASMETGERTKHIHVKDIERVP